MFKIKTYTVGWDTNKKEGYINATDENNKSHILGQLGVEEFSILVDLLKQDKVHIDKNRWIVTGWDKEFHSNNK